MNPKLVKNSKLYDFFIRYQPEIAIITSLGMIYGFLAGRAILSLSMFLFFLNSIWNTKPAFWAKQKWWLWGLAWLGLYAVSYFWSTDIPYWQERVQVKLPFLIFPIAMACLPRLKEKHFIWLTYGLVFLAICACTYSLSFYFNDTENVLNGYFYSKVLRTPAYKDHIRFSIFIAWVVIWACFILPKIRNKILKALLISALFYLSIYLHILAVRSGLLMLYSFAFVYVVFLFLQRKFLLSSLLVLGSSLIVFTLFKTTPSFRGKLYYGMYSLNEYRKGNVTADFSDIGRIISYQLAAKIIRENPLLGVGAGDIRSEMKEKYEQYSPNTKPEQRIVPHNQIMEVSLAGGIITLSVFLVWLFYPIRKIKKNRSGLFLFATWFGLLLCLMVEAMLEVQFGVSIYLFCMLWVMKFAQDSTESNPVPATELV